jgi:hypothetical protein
VRGRYFRENFAQGGLDLAQVVPELVTNADAAIAQRLEREPSLVRSLYRELERVLKPIIDAEERRAGAHLIAAGRAVRARDEVGLRALNDALRAAFDAPGAAGFARGGAASAAPPVAEESIGAPPSPGGRVVARETALGAAMRFRQSPIRLHPGERRGVSLLFDPERVPPGTAIDVVADPGYTSGCGQRPCPPRGGSAGRA